MHDKDAWGCGFCASLLTTWEERCEHISRHLEENRLKWSFTNVILGLLKQPYISEAWNMTLTQKYGESYSKPQFTWESKKCNRLRYKLETKWDMRMFSMEKLAQEIYELAEIEQTESTDTSSHVALAQDRFPLSSIPTSCSPISPPNASEDAVTRPQYYRRPTSTTYTTSWVKSIDESFDTPRNIYSIHSPYTSQSGSVLDEAFICGKCAQSFNSSYDLRRHRKIHLEKCGVASLGPVDQSSSMPSGPDTMVSPSDIAIRNRLLIQSRQAISSPRVYEGDIEVPIPLKSLWAELSADEIKAPGVLRSHSKKTHIILAPSRNGSNETYTLDPQSSDNESDESVTERTSSRLSDIGTTYDVSASVFSPFRDGLLRRLLSCFLESLQNTNELVRSIPQTSDLGESSSYQPASSTQNANNHGKKHKRKSKFRNDREQDGDGDDEDEKEKEKERGSKKTKFSYNSNHEKLLACPFCKLNPHRYRGCYKYVLKDISRLKQHLSRCHRVPIHCALCSEAFDSEEERDEHLRELTCEKLPPVQWDGVNEKQRKQLEQRVSTKVSLEENWYRIFEILFPGKPRPKSPYVGRMLSADLLALQDFFFSEGIIVVREVVDGTLPPSLQPQEDEVQAFLETAFQDAVGILLARWESMNHNTSSLPVLPWGLTEGNSVPIPDARSTSRSDEDQSSAEGSKEAITPLSEPSATQIGCQKPGHSDLLDMEGFDWSVFINTFE
jgi:hypothetical protein